MNEFDEEKKRDVAFRTALVDRLEAIIRETVPEERDLIDQPAVLAELIGRFGHDRRDFESCVFEATISGCVGRAIMQEVDSLAWLADTLHAKGYTEENHYDFCYADRYAFSLLNADKKKVFALRTQNINYLVLLTRRYDGWEVHMRQWWDVLPDSTNQYLPYTLEKYIKGETMTLHDAIRLSKNLDDYANDIPGVSYPDRLRLQAFKDTNFAVGKNESCAGFRYGDARDRGYIATVKQSVWGAPEADKMTWHALNRMHYVWYDLLSAVDTFREESAAEAETAEESANAEPTSGAPDSAD
jgi:hypothetical protein